MDSSHRYPVGKTGIKWTEKEKKDWFNLQTVKRSYQDEVLVKLENLSDNFEISPYGELSYQVDKYPLFAIKNKNWHADKPTVLVTGGVHGYETSGVQGAIRFIEKHAAFYSDKFNLLITPCISPWGYETINRWNAKAVDPNRSFYKDSPAEESAAVMALVASLNVKLMAHIDLHETTDSDNSEFRPALAARDAVFHEQWAIPDGFYLVGDSENPNNGFQKAIIEAVQQVTHIAPADPSGRIIGEKISQFGVINYATKALGLCTGFSDAKYNTTTEVYPDSPLVDDENCIIAQVAAITSALDHIVIQEKL
jgi:hypothetical protein